MTDCNNLIVFAQVFRRLFKKRPSLPTLLYSGLSLLYQVLCSVYHRQQQSTKTPTADNNDAGCTINGCCCGGLGYCASRGQFTLSVFTRTAPVHCTLHDCMCRHTRGQAQAQLRKCNGKKKCIFGGALTQLRHCEQ